MAENNLVSTGSNLISISLDLSGSTFAKQTIVACSTNDPEHRKQLYEEYLSLLFNVEATFYQLVRYETDLDLARLFLVKSIGDELWYLYPVEPGDDVSAQRVAAALMKALLGTLEKRRRLSIPSRRVSDTEGNHQSGGVQWTQFDLPLKACIDLLHEGAELNLKRFERLKGQLVSLSHELEGDLDEQTS